MVEGYVSILIKEYFLRRNVNSRYSERAFAQALGLSPGFLKLLFQGKKRLSVDRAREVACRLNLKEPYRASFLRSVERVSPSMVKLRSAKHLIEEEDFIEISDWFCFAILELVKVNRGHLSLDDLVRQLGISKTEAKFATNQLIKLRLLKMNDDSGFVAAENYEIPSISSRGIRHFHRQMLNKALQSIDQQKTEERDLRGLTLAFESAQIDEARKEIQSFCAQFEKKFGAAKADSVYQLSIAMFRLDRKGAK